MMAKLDDVVEDIKELLFSHNTISLWLTKDVCVYVGIKNSIDLGWYADKIMVYNINKNKQYHVAAEYIKNQIDTFMKEYKSKISKIFFSFTKSSTILSPNPSIFKQFLLAK